MPLSGPYATEAEAIAACGAVPCASASGTLDLAIVSTAPELDGTETTITEGDPGEWASGAIAGCEGGGFVLICTGTPASWTATFNGCALVQTGTPGVFPLAFEMQAADCSGCSIDPDGIVPVGTDFIVSEPP